MKMNMMVIFVVTYIYLQIANKQANNSINSMELYTIGLYLSELVSE